MNLILNLTQPNPIENWVGGKFNNNCTSWTNTNQNICRNPKKSLKQNQTSHQLLTNPSQNEHIIGYKRDSNILTMVCFILFSKC
jgi:hypothetical protein